MNTTQVAAAAAEITNSPIPAIATLWSDQGGRNAGLVRGINGGPDYFLIYADDPAAETSLAWGGYNVDEPGAKSDHDGLANTRALIVSEHSHPAAEFAGECRVGGFDDWYIPSRREWRILVGNVPEAFAPDWHWSSTQYSRYDAWMQDFDDGYQLNDDKDGSRRVRLVRRFKV